MAKGLLYFAQNSAFQHLTKIGRTTKLEVEDRGLSASNVPEDFDYLAVFECDDVEWAEKKVHEQFAGFRHHSQTNRKTEFFWSGCVKDAIKYARDLKGVYDKTENETEEIEVVNQGGETEIKKTPKTTFEMIQLPIGATILYRNDKQYAAVVRDKNNKIEYKGKVYTISALALKLYNEQTNANQKTINGYMYFYHDGKKLFDMRPDQRDKD